MLLIAGDWNAKIGKKPPNSNEACVGMYSRGERNNSGQNLINFCTMNELFITNSAFPHKARHISTWENQRINPNTNKLLKIYNQIDYIICQTSKKCVLVDSRSYAGTQTSSDHRLVICKMLIEPYKMFKKKSQIISKPYNTEVLVHSSEKRDDYKNKLNEKLSDLNSPSWENIKQEIKLVAEETVGIKQSHKCHKTYYPEIEEMSKEQKALRLQIANTANESKIKELKKERNAIVHRMEDRLNKLKSAELDSMAESIEKYKDSTKMFKVLKQMHRKPLETPTVFDDEGKTISNTEDVYAAIRTHFEKHFNDPDATDFPTFEGPPAPLVNPVTVDETKKAIFNLNNNRSPGDNMTIFLLNF